MLISGSRQFLKHTSYYVIYIFPVHVDYFIRIEKLCSLNLLAFAKYVEHVWHFCVEK
jgi:hypothetical protein